MMQINPPFLKQISLVCILLLASFSTEVLAHGRGEVSQHATYTPAKGDATDVTGHGNIIGHGGSNPQTEPSVTSSSPATVASGFKELHAAVDVMQNSYFSLWLGKWTTAIDWTAAVTGTHLSAALSSFSRSLSYTMPGILDRVGKLDVKAQLLENEINKYFSQSITYYFGEEYFSIRNQAYDDMLWVVLGWLESVQFINGHTKRHHPRVSKTSDRVDEWHAQQFIPAFAHRARVFYELAEKGWDWELCGGGMTWNPRLLPYKNAITNQLFISSSVAMYLHFPGDDNCSPFAEAEADDPYGSVFGAKESRDVRDCTHGSSSTYDPVYLVNAINGYDWLANSGMKNEQGLYTDGFHIKDYASNHSNTECDERNEMVYTYNQGVVLSGLRGLWEATGNTTYLVDAHELVRNVMLATGWKAAINSASETFESPDSRHGKRDQASSPADTWAGLGAHGILSELCDSSGTCTQDGQTFKGIFFHHLTAFCTRLPRVPAQPSKTHAASRLVAQLHRNSCAQYTPWVVHNAQAALETRDHKGRFGMWWGAGRDAETSTSAKPIDQWLLSRAIDYRNDPALLSRFSLNEEAEAEASELRMPFGGSGNPQADPNDRGRGRTVETQGGGVAVIRAMWEFLKRQEEDVSGV